MAQQGVEQAAYRKGFSTDDHLLAVTQIIERSRESDYPVWMALVDFEKAFDTVEHEALWKVLEDQRVPIHYISLLKSLYQEQVAAVQTDVRSRSFRISR
eukprot:4045647-Karenia_brevis.AAC.1